MPRRGGGKVDPVIRIVSRRDDGREVVDEIVMNDPHRACSAIRSRHHHAVRVISCSVEYEVVGHCVKCDVPIFRTDTYRIRQGRLYCESEGL